MNDIKRTAAYRRTDQAIMDAFIRLVNEKSFEAVTVQDILNATPVCRTTFYVHYQDKYALAQALLDKAYDIYQDTMEQFLTTEVSNYGNVVRSKLMAHYDMMMALGKIHTSEVDFNRLISETFEKTYLDTTPESKHKRDAAWLYAQNMVALQKLYLDHAFDPTTDLGVGFQDEMIFAVMLHFLQLDGDEETIRFIRQRQREKGIID